MKTESEWREKYLETVEKLETGEIEWKKLDTVLRTLTSRLCLAAQGRDDRLDDELRRVNERIRAQANAPKLFELIDPLSRAIAALDPGPAPVASIATTQTALKITLPPEKPPEPAAATQTELSSGNSANTQKVRSAAIVATLRRLSAMPELASALDPLQEKPPSQVSADELASALQDLTGIIGDQRTRLQREKLEVEHLLMQMNLRLEEISAHLASDIDRVQGARDSSQQLDSAVMGEVLDITTTVRLASDLGELRRQVSGRLDAIGTHFQEFRSREDERSRVQVDGANHMRERIAELERESRVLQDSLKHEQKSALIDALTGIPNRAAYDERVNMDFQSWRATNVPFCLLAWDLDHFKEINDQYGHKAGDRVLRIIGQHLAAHVRSTDFVARYGGEEFVMILAETSIDEAIGVADKIRLGIAGLAFHFRNVPVTVTASCGITTFRPGDSVDLAFERADQALYRAKDEGRNRCVSR